MAATPVARPEMLIISADVAQTLAGNDWLTQDWSTKDWSTKDWTADAAQVFSGNAVASGMQPHATRYGGHQFGHWAGQLGDGRALSLGEVEVGREKSTEPSTKSQSLEIQLKGAGPTPYSRRGDGRAVLRSSLREFLCSEAMHFLGVPTTRALCCVTTGEPVIRDLFYDGHPAPEPGAITTRVAPTFLRFGHFQILAADKAAGRNVDLLARLVDYTREHFFEGLSRDEWFAEICKRTAELMVHWMRVGFVHGVMNTDNMSVLGLTIDYGPYGWMDLYNPDFTPNTTDAEHGRYRYSQQAAVAMWNLTRFADALALLSPDETQWLQAGLEWYAQVYNQGYLKMMSQKLGLRQVDVAFVEQLDQVLTATEVDPTIFYRLLADVRATVGQGAQSGAGDARGDTTVGGSVDGALTILAPAFYAWPIRGEALVIWQVWLTEYLRRAQMDLLQDGVQSAHAAQQMNSVNPYFILRNYLVQEALDDLAQGDRSQLDRLALALQTPYEVNPATQAFFKKMPDWARNRAGCSALSCSS